MALAKAKKEAFEGSVKKYLSQVTQLLLLAESKLNFTLKPKTVQRITLKNTSPQ